MESGLLSLTPKGQNELVQNAHKFNLKKRSVLLLLKNNRQEHIKLADVVRRGVLSAGEAWSILEELINEEFVSFEGEAAEASHAAPPLQAQQATQPVSALPTSRPIVEATATLFSEDINLSEARFLLNDFCLDVFKTQAQRYAKSITECKTVPDLVLCVNELRKQIEVASPGSLVLFEKVIQEIKQTAR